MKKKILLGIVSLSTAAVAATLIFSSGNLDNWSTYALQNRDVTPGEYTLTLDVHNQLDTDDGDTFYSKTSLGNKVYFAFDDTVERNPENGWLSLTDGGTFHNPYVFNTSKIKGMKSIQIVSDYNNLKLHYGCEVDGEIVYSNYVEFDTTTINYTFTEGQEPSYIKIEGYTGTNPNLLEDVIIEYSCSESAETPTENLAYEQIEGKQEYRILGFTERKENIPDDLVIPSYINGKPVTEIGDDAFNGPAYFTLYGIKSITIPNTVKYIGARAFQNCQAVTKINMPTSGIEIGDDAFLYCGSMETVNIGKNQTEIDLAKYQSSPVLTTINVEAGNEVFYSVDGMLFQYSYSDEHVSDKNTLLYCPCAKEGTITIPSGVEYIAPTAFKNSKASTIEISSTVTSIKEDFTSAKSLTTFVVDSNNLAYTSISGLLCSSNGQLLITYPRGRSETSLNIPNGIYYLEKRVFYDVDNLTSVTLNGVTHIGDEAFMNMDNLESVTGASISTLGKAAFKNDKKLESVGFASNIRTIPEEAFMGCTSLQGYTFNVELEEIGVSAFEGCTKLTNVIFPNIYSYEIVVRSKAFKGCSSLGAITLNNNLTLEGHVFEDSGLTSITFSEVMTSIPDSLCQNCDLLESLSIPANITTIGYDAFNDCDRLHRVDFTDSGENLTIHSKAFLSCANFYKVFLPSRVTTIEASAFNQGRLFEVYAEISGLGNGEPFDYTKKPGWNSNMCGPYYNLISGDREYFESQF